jgi:hypothetical protein
MKKRINTNNYWGVYEYNTRFSRQNSKKNSPALGGLNRFLLNTQKYLHILIFSLKITFLKAFCYTMIEKKFRKKDVNFWVLM